MFKKIFASEKIRKIVAHFGEWIISGFIGAIIGLFFNGDYMQAVIIMLCISLVLFIVLITNDHFEEKYDILKILNDEISAENYPIVIQIGYTLSRSLHLSGRYALREAIGQYMLSACRKMEEGRKIRINEDKILVEYIEAKTLIDDLGWNVHLIGQSDIAIDNIEKGIEVAETISEYGLILKGYRHILGIYNVTNRIEERDIIEQKARLLLENDEYKAMFKSQDAYNHAVAEYDYAYAKTLIDEKPEESLRIARKVQEIFSAELTEDRDRYCKTFDLIGDIYARYDNIEKLKMAKNVYLEGIGVCERHGRSERLITIAIDYIALLLKMMRVCKHIFAYISWEQQIDREEKGIYEKALLCAKRIENKKLIQRLKLQHKEYLRYRKKMRIEYRKGEW